MAPQCSQDTLNDSWFSMDPETSSELQRRRSSWRLRRFSTQPPPARDAEETNGSDGEVLNDDWFR